jgi:hypothetical protein
MKICPSATTSTTNPTESYLESNLGHHGGKMVTNCQSYGMVISEKPFSQSIIDVTELVPWVLNIWNGFYALA